MFALPNFLRPEQMPNSADFAIDVGHCFPNDDAADEFWMDCRAKWIEHVRLRREALKLGQQPQSESDA